MQVEKVQLLATAKVPGKYKTHWLHWWNMSKDSRQSYNFPKSPGWGKLSLMLIGYLNLLTGVVDFNSILSHVAVGGGSWQIIRLDNGGGLDYS